MNTLDATLAALSDSTRRAILARLAQGETTVMELAAPFQMTQPAVSRHLKVLETAGLITRRVDGSRRPCRLVDSGMQPLEQWLAIFRDTLTKNYDRLDQTTGSSKPAIDKSSYSQTTSTTERGKNMSDKLSLKTEGETHVIVTRRFTAPPEAVYRAHTDPALIQKWMLGPEGWTMPVCIVESRPHGKMRFEWSDGKGHGFYLTGECLELDPPRRIVHVERMHLPDPTPDNHVETRFDPDGEGTLMTIRMTLPDAETRSRMLATGMEGGMEASYVRLETLL